MVADKNDGNLTLGSDPDVVAAQLQYLAPTRGRAIVYVEDDGTNPAASQLAQHAVSIRNGRPRASALALDREGFILRRHRTATTNFDADEEIVRSYYSEIEKLVAAEIGASKVVISAHTVRNSGLRKGAAAEPVRRVHVDYTAVSGPRRIRNMLGREIGDAWLKRRVVEVNTWQPIHGPVLSTPLALCDAQTVKSCELFPTDLILPTGAVSETYSVLYSPKHRWFYFPKMATDEILLFKCFDSTEDGRARFTPHAAFDDPTVLSGAPARQSIEVRAFALLEEL